MAEGLAQACAITRRLPVAEGYSVKAGDVVDVGEDRQIVKDIEAIPAAQNVVTTQRANNVQFLNAVKLNETHSVVSWHWNSLDYHDDYCNTMPVNNQTGVGTMSVPDLFYSKNANSLVTTPIIRISDTRFVLGCINETNTLLFFGGRISGNNLSHESATEVGAIVKGNYADGVPLSNSRFFYIWPQDPTNYLWAVVCAVDRPGASANIVVDGKIESNLTGTQVHATRLPDEGEDERVLVTYLDVNNSSCPTAVIASIHRDNTITFGPAAVIDTTGKSIPSCCTDTDGNAIVFYGGQYIKVLSVAGDTVTPAPSALDMGSGGNRQHILMVGTTIVAVWHDGKQHSYAAVITRKGMELRCGEPYEWLAGWADSAAFSTSGTSFTIVFTKNGADLNSTMLEVNGDQIAGSFLFKAFQAIALQDGNAGDLVDIIYSGTAGLPGTAQGTKIESPGVQGYAPMEGLLEVYPWYGPNTKIATGSYVGTGLVGSANPNVLTFDFEPKLVVFCGQGMNSARCDGVLVKGNYSRFYTGGGASGSIGFGPLTVSFNGNSVSWYTSETAGNYQANVKGETYHYIAIG